MIAFSPISLSLNKYQTPLPKQATPLVYPRSEKTVINKPAQNDIHHHENHEEEGAKTPAQRIGALGTGVLLTTAVNLLVTAENKLPPTKPKSAALLSTDVGTWVKSLGLLAGVQGINAGLGLHLPPVINALELGAVSHLLIPGTAGSRVAHFMTMAPVLVGSVAATQAAHAVIDHTVERNNNLDEKQKQLTKSVLGFAVSVGMGIGAMAAFPRIHLGLSGLNLKLQPKTAKGVKALENWYVTTTKTVDGWGNGVTKAWEQVQAKVKNGWDRTWNKAAEKPAINTGKWFDSSAFTKNSNAPWEDKTFYKQKPETKLYILQESHSQTLDVLPEPKNWLEKTMQWVNGKQSATARAVLATKWGADGTPILSSEFSEGGKLEQFQARYKHDVGHNMVQGVAVIAKNAKGIEHYAAANPSYSFTADSELNAQLMVLVKAINKPENKFQKETLGEDFKLMRSTLLPQIEKITKRLGELANDPVQDPSTVLQKQLGLDKIPAYDVLDLEQTRKQELLQLYKKTDHLKGHIPSVSSFWAMTGAAAGAVTCGSGCCAGSFFCLNEATALFGSLFGALVGKKVGDEDKTPEPNNEKQKTVKA